LCTLGDSASCRPALRRVLDALDRAPRSYEAELSDPEVAA
jgi:hypothetical protein